MMRLSIYKKQEWHPQSIHKKYHIPDVGDKLQHTSPVVISAMSNHKRSMLSQPEA